MLVRLAALFAGNSDRMGQIVTVLTQPRPFGVHFDSFLPGPEGRSNRRTIHLKTATIQTSRGTISLELYPEQAPKTVANFEKLAGEGFYDGLKFHRVIANFMIQTGCPSGTGTGGPGYTFEDECDASLTHDSAGILSMANAGPNTNGSQFFITHVPCHHLDGKHTVFGRVVQGQDVVDSIEQGDVMEKVSIQDG